ncbi:MAG: 3-oxoacyl-[acyl-carrier protein] reductase [Solirubrobacteraceae bacterium]|jgi:NAD(P)-dependent dehydrogenase (short-subunit alcohol dehydrogenase family)|nr:3-oxoacyl-[acyl-carrier protein] reductase [Solirubrobacteraceae bacterium]
MPGLRVLVTGSSRGIGAACAQAFAARGDRVAVHYATGRDAAEAVRAALPGEGHAVVGGDLADPEQVRGFVDAAAQALGGLDVLVNNAAVFEAHPAGSTDYAAWQAAWERTLAINLLGAANATFCALAHFRSGGGGRVVNVSSRGAFRGEPDTPAYGASKAGLNAMGQSLAVALAGDGVAVMTVAPGFVETDMAAELLAGPQGDAIRAQSPFGRVARPEEVAATVVHLAAEAPEFLSGCVVDVNGASYLRT